MSLGSAVALVGSRAPHRAQHERHVRCEAPAIAEGAVAVRFASKRWRILRSSGERLTFGPRRNI